MRTRNDDENYFDLFMFPVDGGERSCSAVPMNAFASMALCCFFI